EDSVADFHRARTLVRESLRSKWVLAYYVRLCAGLCPSLCSAYAYPVIALALLFILSGAAGLIYESVWARYISLLVGHSAYAQVIVLVIFLGGMAIGSLSVGRWSERIQSPLLWYAIVEAAIALIALVFHSTFVAATSLAYDHVLPSLGGGASIKAAT